MYDDLRYALRGLRGAKLTVGVLVASFAVGTGANAVLYRAMDALIFRPPAGVVQPARLVNVFTSGFGGGTYGLSSYPDFFSLERGTPALAALAAFDDSTVDVVHLEGTARRMRIVAAGPGFFPVLGVQASLGHVPRFDEHGPDAESAALSFDLWTTAGRPADIIGKRIPVLTGYFAQAETLGPAAFAGAAAAYAFSLAQRRLSNEARGIRRRATAVEGQITWDDGREEALDTTRLLAPHEAALRALAAGHVLIACALVIAGLS